MKEIKNKNILIARDFDSGQFLKDKTQSEWLVFSLKEFVKNYRRFIGQKFNSIVVGSHLLDDKNFRYPLELFLLFLQAKEKYFIDNQNLMKKISFWRFLFIDTPLFIGEMVYDLLLVIFSWIALFIFYFLPKRGFLPANRQACPSGRQGFTPRNDDLKKIVYLRTDIFRGLQEGGSLTHFRGVVKGFDKLDYKIHYIGSGIIEVPNLPTQIFQKKTWVGKDFPKTIIPYPNKFNLPEIPEIYYNWRFISKVYKLIQKEKPLFIYQRHSIFNVCGAALSLLTKIPLILEYNGSEPWVRQKWGGLLIFKRLCYFFENICLRRADIIIVVSEPLKDELINRKIPADKILVNYNGVDCDEFNPNINGSEIRKKYHLEDKIVIGALSTFGIWHGMPILSQAIKPLSEKLQVTSYKLHVLFIGDGVTRSECERIIQESGVKDYVTFTGTISYQEIPKYLAACDILVSPHISNPDSTPFFGSPTKLFEYMAMGKGIVASDLGQIGEVLEHNKTALLVKPGDVEDLVNGITELVQSKELRETLGKNARKEVVKNYTWKQNVKKVIDCFKNL